MSKYIIVSNRLPVKIEKLHNQWKFSSTSGGLATGLKTVHENGKSLWIGWAGISGEAIEKDDYSVLSQQLIKENYKPIALTQKEIDDFYLGLSNKCIWPLFHYFKQYVEFDEQQWESYVAVNQKFANAITACPLGRHDIWICYKTIYIPSLLYSLPATTIMEKEFEILHKMLMPKVLP